MDEAKGIIFYESWYKALQGMEPEVRLEVLDAVLLYGFENVEPVMSPTAKMAFTFIKGRIDKDKERYKEKCTRRREAANSRWHSNNPRNANDTNVSNCMQNNANDANASNCIQMHNLHYNINGNGNGNGNGNSIKENNNVVIVKEKRANKLPCKQVNLGEIELKFKEALNVYANQYPEEMLHEFAEYWLEPNKSQTKLRFQMESTWDLSKRLARWARNAPKFKGGKQLQKGTTLSELNAMITGANGEYIPLPDVY